MKERCDFDLRRSESPAKYAATTAVANTFRLE